MWLAGYVGGERDSDAPLGRVSNGVLTVAWYQFEGNHRMSPGPMTQSYRPPKKERFDGIVSL